ncbi:MAG: AbrB/MazE/SpoVT family DNA-binding domain-containing protein [Sulfolobus sp.]|nr:AbrB/MazE/SpoVT family DNA-binding domain-containing protein [Sulfolobus sp.]
MKTEVRVGKKLMIRIPKGIAEELGIKENDKLLLRVIGRDKIVLEVIRDPVWLALHGKKFASVTLEEIENISEEEQKRIEDTN